VDFGVEDRYAANEQFSFPRIEITVSISYCLRSNLKSIRTVILNAARSLAMAETQSSAELAALASHLAARREVILERWLKAVQSDPHLASYSFLSRSQFHDHIPAVLDAFECELRAEQRSETAAAEKDQKEGAADHGLHRWQFGYNQNELIREWGHLHLCLVDELENYAATHRDLQGGVMSYARRTLALLCSNGVNESVSRYARVQQIEAAGRVRDLERALGELKALERQRADMWREAAHDLRGNVGVVKNLIEILNREGSLESVRNEDIGMLQRSIGSLHVLLDDLLTLSRVEAGQEQRKVESFDAAALLTELCTETKTLAAERGLFLETDGPAPLSVQGDPVKVRRIAQNLILNALKYTAHGGARVTWAEHANEGLARWTLCIQDTGSGFQTASVTPLARVLKEATEEARTLEIEAGDTGEMAARSEPGLASQSVHKPAYESGEGIGLSIVKRLCELLEASVEVESEPGKGSTFRIIFPRLYEFP
jgi:signal transduction histidine kinase